jgi:hypothetical protein
LTRRAAFETVLHRRKNAPGGPHRHRAVRKIPAWCGGCAMRYCAGSFSTRLK